MQYKSLYQALKDAKCIDQINCEQINEHAFMAHVHFTDGLNVQELTTIEKLDEQISRSRANYTGPIDPNLQDQLRKLYATRNLVRRREVMDRLLSEYDGKEFENGIEVKL